MKKNLLGRTVKITSDNDCYDKFRDKLLVITHVAYSEEDHPGYDSSMKGQALCDLMVKDTGEQVGFSLYEWEFHLQPQS